MCGIMICCPAASSRSQCNPPRRFADQGKIFCWGRPGSPEMHSVKACSHWPQTPCRYIVPSHVVASRHGIIDVPSRVTTAQLVRMHTQESAATADIRSIRLEHEGGSRLWPTRANHRMSAAHCSSEPRGAVQAVLTPGIHAKGSRASPVNFQTGSRTRSRLLALSNGSSK